MKFSNQHRINLFFIGGQFSDSITTYIAVRFLHQTEMNPLVNLSMQTIGVEASLLVKLLISSALLYVFNQLKHWQNSVNYSLIMGSVITWLVSISNLFVILTFV